MTPGVYDFPTQYGGDRTNAVPIDFSIDLTSVTAEFRISLNGAPVLQLSLGEGLSLLGNRITIEPFDIPNPSKDLEKYSYDLKLTFPGGASRTYIAGKFPVMKNLA